MKVEYTVEFENGTDTKKVVSGVYHTHELTEDESEELHQVEIDLKDYLYSRLVGQKITPSVIDNCKGYIRDFVTLTDGKYKYCPAEEFMKGFNND